MARHMTRLKIKFFNLFNKKLKFYYFKEKGKFIFEKLEKENGYYKTIYESERGQDGSAKISIYSTEKYKIETEHE